MNDEIAIASKMVQDMEAELQRAQLAGDQDVIDVWTEALERANELLDQALQAWGWPNAH